MKRWLVFICAILLFSCDFSIPLVTFTFDNQSSKRVTITPNPNTGEDWLEFIVPIQTQRTVQSVKTSIDFTIIPDSDQSDSDQSDSDQSDSDQSKSVQYTDYDSATYTYTLTD